MSTVRRLVALCLAALLASCSTVGDRVETAGSPTTSTTSGQAIVPSLAGRSDTTATPSSVPGSTGAATSATAGPSLTIVGTAGGIGEREAEEEPAAPVDDFVDSQPVDDSHDLPDVAEDEPVVAPDYGRDIGGSSLPRPGKAGPVAPAPPSGALSDGGGGPGRPALVVKVDNAWGAWPQSGINQADVTFEILVEGISRFASVYHSETPALVGPIRSARTSDLNLVAMLDRPLFGWSGGNPGVSKALASNSGLVDVGFYVKPNSYFRSAGREMPHNLYASSATLWASGSSAGSPSAIFDYRSPLGAPPPPPPTAGSPPSTAGPPPSAGSGPVKDIPTSLAPGIPVGGIEYALAETQVAFVWQRSTERWLRFQSNYPHLDDRGIQVSPTNVVVLETPYQPSVIDARSPEALTIGSGRAWVLVEGRAIEGTWLRGSTTSPYTLTAVDGRRIELLAGRTWVALVLPGGSARMLDTSFIKP